MVPRPFSSMRLYYSRPLWAQDVSGASECGEFQYLAKSEQLTSLLGRDVHCHFHRLAHHH